MRRQQCCWIGETAYVTGRDSRRWGSSSEAPLSIFIGQKETCMSDISQQRLELTARTSLVWTTGVSTCGNHTYTIPCRALKPLDLQMIHDLQVVICALNGHISCVVKFEGKLQTQVVGISFLDLWNVLWTLNLLQKGNWNHVTYMYVCVWTLRSLRLYPARPRATLCAFRC